ncbi:MAG TPA: lysophospholipid acyltransferase family protein [Casimicrobiaceae bacterium]|nr:lysophospholipid acyltransferase family protein [Casimicrobiaceae bacterium]
MQNRVAQWVQAWRAFRVTVHFLQGLATTILVFPLIGTARRRSLIRRWSGKLVALLHVSVRMKGTIEADGGNLLIVANHVSWLDIFVIDAQHPARFVAKSELASWPLMGRLIRGAGTIFVSRERRHDTRRVNALAAQALASGDVVAVFPEGTTTLGDTLLKFHASLLQPIVASQGRVQPVALRYVDARGRRSLAPTYGDESFAESFWRVCGERYLAVEVTVFAPLTAQGVDRRELARTSETLIRSALDLGRL